MSDMNNIFRHKLHSFFKNKILTKKTGLFLLLFLASYTFGTGIGFLSGQFYAHNCNAPTVCGAVSF